MASRATVTAVVLAWLASGVGRAETAVTIIDDIAGAGRLAAPATGQTLYVLDESSRTITAVDPFAPATRWRAVGPTDLDAGAADPVRPAAIACVDSNTLAVVGQSRAGWSLSVFRLAPRGEAAQPPMLLQSLPLGAGPDATTPVDVFVSDTRDWLAVVGLPAPLPPVMRAPIAGARLGGFSNRLCPTPMPSETFVAATSSPFDEWVLFSPRGPAPPGRIGVAFLDNAGRHRLLDLDIGLTGVRDAAFCRSVGTLWVVADGDGTGTGAAGLWRIDAAMQAGRQAARPVAVARLHAPLSVACLSERAVVISGGGDDRRVLLVNPVEITESSP